MKSGAAWIAGWVGALALCASASLAVAATNMSREPIPPLRPPRPELPPGFWEQNGFWVGAGATASLTVVVGLSLLLARPRRVPEPQPAAKARRELEELKGLPETGALLSTVSQATKEYFRETFGLPRQELTTAEFCRVTADNPQMGQELVSRVGDFLRRCDSRKFAPRPPNESGDFPSEALSLVDAGETRREEIDRQERERLAAG